MNEEFRIMDCALIAIATGDYAQNLKELRDRLAVIHPGCIYYHFWGGLLRPRFDDPEFQNDFAIWSSRALHDGRLAEQLSLIDPNVYTDLEGLRRETIEIIEQRLYETEYIPWARAGDSFYFVRSQIVVFDTGLRISEPRELTDVIPKMSLGSVFYHFIDARRRTAESMNDFSLWLASLGESYASIAETLNRVDPYFTTLSDLRREILAVFRRNLEEGA